MSAYQLTGHCVIRNFSIIRNQERCFVSSSTALDDFFLEAYAALAITYPKFYKMDNLSKLGFLAAEVILKNRQLFQHYPPESVAVVLSNAHGSLDTDVHYWESTKTQASPALFVYTLPNIVTGEICIRHGIKGENAFLITPRCDLVLLTEYSGMVLEQPGTQCCLAGWVDVMDDHHDVFLYLIEKSEDGISMEEIRAQLQHIYQLNYGKINS